MSLKKVTIFLFTLIFMLPVGNVLAQSNNTGFVSGNIWYSKEPLEEGEKVKIYTFIFNPNSRELSGTVIFFDKTVLLGKKDFVVPPRDALDVSIDWTVTAGSHAIFGRIDNARFFVSKGVYEKADLAEDETDKNSQTVSKRIVSGTEVVVEDKTENAGPTSISSIKDTILEKTPEFVSKPIISATNSLEKVREDTRIATDIKREEVRNEIKVLEEGKTEPKEDKAGSPLLKPFKQIELFLLSLFSVITGDRIIFYGILIVIIFSILRFIFNKILY